MNVTHLSALLHLKASMEQVKARARGGDILTERERDVLQALLERADEQAASLLTPQRMQTLTSQTSREEKTGR